MAGLLSGLESLGLGNLENMDIFGKEKKEAPAKQEKKAPEVPEFKETDFIYDKAYKCPVCDHDFTAKIMKTGKAKIKKPDFDLRLVYEGGFVAEKYDVVLCPTCGYATLTRYHGAVLPTQARLIKENITSNIVLSKYNEDTYSFEQALERYKIALACAVVKRSKASEKAFICLKTAWLLRSYREFLEAEEGDFTELIKTLTEQEAEYHSNAYNGFIEARSSEDVPIAGMDSVTLDYLLANLAFHLKDYPTCSRMVAGILSSPSAKPRMKDKVRELKEELAKIKQ